MCIGVPVRIVDVCGASAIVERQGVRTQLDTMLIDTPRVGDFVLAFGHRAVRALGPEEASQIDAALDAIERRCGEEFDGSDAFADLDREPQLPEHLRGAP